jgi:hypothetical protein
MDCKIPVTGDHLENGDSAMPEYQIYSIGLDGYATAADGFECANDLDAINKTLQVTEGHDTELWERDRFIVRMFSKENPT